MNNNHKDKKIGFNIGWDYFVSDLMLPSYIKDDSDCYSIVEGYKEASSRKIRKIPADRFTRKWLQLRVNAWRRNRHINEDVTPEYIKSIDVIRCPITNDLLTHSNNEYSDWSVDRVNNNAAYAIGNLVVVSTRANIAKGNYSMSEMIEFAHSDKPIPTKINYKENINPLSKIEWAKWVTICSHGLNDDNDIQSIKNSYFAPCVIYPPHGLRGRCFSVLQIIIARKAKGHDNGEYKKIVESISKNKRPLVQKILKKAEKQQVNKHLEIWYNQKLFFDYLGMFILLEQEEKHKILKVAFRHFDTETYEINPDDYHFDKNGYS